MNWLLVLLFGLLTTAVIYYRPRFRAIREKAVGKLDQLTRELGEAESLLLSARTERSLAETAMNAAFEKVELAERAQRTAQGRYNASAEGDFAMGDPPDYAWANLVEAGSRTTAAIAAYEEARGKYQTLQRAEDEATETFNRAAEATRAGGIAVRLPQVLFATLRTSQ